MPSPLDPPKFKLAPMLLWIIKIYWVSFPLHTVLYIVTATVRQLSPLVYSFIYAKIIDQLVQFAANTSGTVTDLVPLVAVLFVYNLVDRFNSSIYRYVRRAIAILAKSRLRIMLYTKLQDLGIQTLEDPDVQNKLRRVDENLELIREFMEIMTDFVASTISMISAAVVLFTFMPLALPVLVLLAIPSLMVQRIYIQKDWQFEYSNTEIKRKAFSHAGVLMDVKMLQEIFVVGAYGFFNQKFTAFVAWWNERKLGLRRKYIAAEFVLETLNNVGTLSIYFVLFGRFAIERIITIGDLTFQMRSIGYFQNTLSGVTDLYTALNESGSRIVDVMELMQMQNSYRDGEIELPRFSEPPQIEIQNMAFHYPNATKNIFENLNLTIKRGEKLAIVGHNGAGKTTLIKLLSRLYQVNSGSILINGENINDIKINDWYKNIGVLFQDYNVYPHLSAAENIYIGRTSKQADMEQVKTAAKHADADEFISEYSSGYEQILSERYKGGIRPSTGQWQKISLARFFYRDASLVIFDEPTAAIDAVSEYKIFNRIYNFFSNKTVIIISHRFSTVRNADRIIVMDQGKIVEEGTHSQLMELDGTYAHAFKLQAEGYQS